MYPYTLYTQTPGIRVYKKKLHKYIMFSFSSMCDKMF